MITFPKTGYNAKTNFRYPIGITFLKQCCPCLVGSTCVRKGRIRRQQVVWNPRLVLILGTSGESCGSSLHVRNADNDLCIAQDKRAGYDRCLCARNIHKPGAGDRQCWQLEPPFDRSRSSQNPAGGSPSLTISPTIVRYSIPLQRITGQLGFGSSVSDDGSDGNDKDSSNYYDYVAGGGNSGGNAPNNPTSTPRTPKKQHEARCFAITASVKTLTVTATANGLVAAGAVAVGTFIPITAPAALSFADITGGIAGTEDLGAAGLDFYGFVSGCK